MLREWCVLCACETASLCIVQYIHSLQLLCPYSCLLYTECFLVHRATNMASTCIYTHVGTMLDVIRQAVHICVCAHSLCTAVSLVSP